jgi:hypothetical protein
MDGHLLLGAFVELTDIMVADFDTIDFLHVLTSRSVELLDVSAAGLLLADPGGELRVVAASSEAARLLELFQLQSDEGPCLDCFRSGRPVASADFTTFEFDERCARFLAEQGAGEYAPSVPDDDAAYAEVRKIDLAGLEPYVARPGKVSGNALPVSGVEDRRVDQCFVGSCANGQLEDLRIAAEILRGRQVATGVRMIVTPASQAVYRDAVRLGYVQDLADAGAVVTNSTCGACFGYHMGVVGDGEVCLTASTRNFRGRMGSPQAEIFRLFRPDVKEPTAADVEEVLRNSMPMGLPWIEPEQISDAVVFLASDSARYITGTVLPVDQGTTNH